MKKIKIIFVLLLAFNCVFSQIINPKTNTDILQWSQKWGKKKLPLKDKSMAKFNLHLEMMLKKEYQRMNSIELSSNVSEAEKLSKDFPLAWTNIQRINPDVRSFLNGNPFFADIEQKVDDANFLHYIIKSKIAFDNKDYIKAVDIASQHNSNNSNNSKALENEENIKCQTLSWFTEQVIDEYGNTDPTQFVNSVKQLMEFKDHVGFDFTKFPCLENLKGQWNNYDEFIEAMRMTGYNRIISTTENLMSMHSYKAGTDLYNLAKGITLTNDEKNRIRDLQIELNEYAIVYYKGRIEAAFDSDDFITADKLEAEILTFSPHYKKKGTKKKVIYYENQIQSAFNANDFVIADTLEAEMLKLNPHYKKQGTEKKVDFYKQKLDVAFDDFDWTEAKNLEGLIKDLHPNYKPVFQERKYLWLLGIAKEHFQNKEWRKAQAKLEQALDLNGSFDKSKGRELLTDTLNEIGYIALQRGMDAAEVSNYDLSEELFKQAKYNLSDKARADDRYKEARNNLGISLLEEARRYNDNRHYYDAYEMAKRALKYLQLPSDAQMIINNVKPKITKTIGFAINVGDDGFNLSKSQEAEIRNKLWHKVKSNDGELVNVLSSHKIPIVNNMREATRYAHSVGAHKILVISVDSYEERGGKDFYGRKKKATIRMEITESYPVTKINIFTGKPYTFCAKRIIGHLCQTAYYRKYVDDVEVKMRFNSKWLDLSSGVSFDENSKSYSNSFHQEVWRTLPIEEKATYQGKIGYEKTMPDYKELSEYAGEECNWTAPLDHTHFKKDRKRVPKHMDLAYPKLLDFIEGVSGKTNFSYRS